MASSRAEVQPLPSDVATKIKSSTSITHLNGVILELAKNSLDAGAKAIHITVDFKRGGCIVEDDGDGIPPAEFESTGGLGKAHHTSRFQKPGKYGHRGLFICSLGALSLLTVTSRHVQHQATNSLIVHHSRPVARLVPAPEHQKLQHSEHGTCVTVNDLFGNMPVRVKSRALAFQKPDELDREWNRLRHSLISLALANIQLRRLVVFDEGKNKRIFVRSDSSPPGLNLNVPGHEVDLDRIGSILSQSGMINSRSMDSWHVLSAKIPDFTISAAMSTLASPSKKIQFISLGQDPVLSQGGSNILFNEINCLISSSDFGLSGFASRSTTATSLSHALEPFDAPRSASSKAWAKPINKWPMFYIRIDTSTVIPMDEDTKEMSPNSEKSLQRIIDVLEAMVTEFLKQQDLHPRISRGKGRPLERDQQATTEQSRSRSFSRPRSVRPSTEESFASGVKLPSFQRPRAVNSSQNLNSWSRVKIAKDFNNRVSLSRNNLNTPDVEAPSLVSRQNSRPISDEHATIISSEVSSIRPSHRLEQEREVHQDEIAPYHQQTVDGMIPWVDRLTGKVHMINSRTGQTAKPPRPDNSRPSADRGKESDHKVWVENLLKVWNNPTFTRTERPLPSFDLETSYLDIATSAGSGFHDTSDLATAQITKFKGKLQRPSLATATIIAQVDHKYILARLNAENMQAIDNPETVLVLIDQHAADERCRIEQLFNEMFLPTESEYEIQVRTVEIDPTTFKISSTEAVLFQRYLSFFGNWGIQYEVKEKPGAEGTVLVKSLPALIAERCRLEPGLVVELLRREIWTNEEDNRKSSGSAMTSTMRKLYGDDITSMDAVKEDSAPHSWVQKMSGCPQSIFDLLNSRACRGAIMFNDPLSIDDCRALVSRLSKCAFPFQCAHGRPSMIPILDLRPQPDHKSEALYESTPAFDCDETENSALDFKEAFQAQYDNEAIGH
ncbi:hypothetical protein N7478_006819 [Penicillium angulare]|uniref:uncharacterized protein n=1 Tax=Penicillium angulare TaxID=116970 RepID=UPI002541AB09|nr:uncharacterized protein N7478_006819 [Penicillium angulare]KAJ5281447.1 hypothetical protein N7478_006819 [Penicillium angulare]